MNGIHVKIAKKIIVWARGGYNQLGILRQLAPYKLDVDVIVSTPSSDESAIRSRYCKRCHVFDYHIDALQFILENYQHYQSKSILFYTSDEIAELVDQNRNKLEEFFIISGTNHKGILTRMQNKIDMTKFAEECGFNVPNYNILTSISPIPTIKYPCFIRPAYNFQSNFQKKMKIDSAEELKMIRYELLDKDEVIVSDYIAKERDLLIIGVRFHNGELYLPGCFIKDRWRNGHSGTGSHGIITPDIPSYINLGAIDAFLSKIDYRGPFSVEYGIMNNKAYFYEVNLRNDGTSDYFNQCGANTVMAWIMDCCGKDKSAVCVPVQKQAYMIDEIHDYANVKSGIISKNEWKKQMKEAKVFVYWNQYDIIPYFYMKWKQINFMHLPKRVYNKLLKLVRIK